MKRSSKLGDVQPMLAAIAKTAARLCEATDAVILLAEGDQARLVAKHGRLRTIVRLGEMVPVTQNLSSHRAIGERRTIHVRNVAKTSPARSLGVRTVLATPLLRDGVAIGSITIRRTKVRPFTPKQIALLKTFADQAAIAIENARLSQALEARNADLSEALEQQTATSDILRVISSSPTDLQPVMGTVAEHAARLCEASDAQIFRVDGDTFHLAASHGPLPPAKLVPVSRGSVAGRAVVDRQTIHIRDIATEPISEFPGSLAKGSGLRTLLAAPLLREGVPIGVILIRRMEVRPFSDKQIALLQTFADQAVIAIENVRLFTELESRNTELRVALEQQTATTELLKVIGRSTFDLQPVFETLAENSVRLCEAERALILRFDGQVLRVAATHNVSPELRAFHDLNPIAPGRGSAAGRAALERRTIHIHDVRTDPEYTYESRQVEPVRTVLSIPMLRAEELLGVIIIYRLEVRPFTDSQIALMETFADQAAIAIENARLLSELQAKNADLTDALEQQTATSEILRAISQSPTDVQPVFDIIAVRAVSLCEAEVSVVSRFDGTLLRLAALHGVTREGVETVRAVFPMRLDAETLSARAFRGRAVIHEADVLADPRYQVKDAARAGGWRGSLAVPMLRGTEVIGVIFVGRSTAGFFTDSQVELLKTFADQAVIAIENVRLFKELQARTGELTQSVEKLTALGEVSQALSSTLDVETVLNTIVSHASRLAGGAGCAIYEYREAAEQFELRATHGYDAAFVEALRAAPLRRGEGLMGRATELREPVQIPDITQPGAYQSSVRDTLMRFGYRALLSVPLLREEQIIGSLSLTRKAPGEYPPEVIEVLKTFGTQSALAIQNARLFREIADKSRQLEVASRHKSEFLANMSHELRTPLNAIIGFSEVLTERMFGELNEKQEEYLKDIHASGQHLLSLINDILDLSKIEAGRMELELTDFDLPMAIDNALTLVRERASRRGVTLKSTVGERVGTIRGDERKMKQVLLNLLSNAIKFTPEGGRVEVAAVREDGAVEVSVSDTGVGIAPEDQEAVFEEFRQVGASAAKQEGTGLGLALCRKFIELHGGTIRVSSEVGTGSTFTFRLPHSS